MGGGDKVGPHSAAPDVRSSHSKSKSRRDVTYAKFSLIAISKRGWFFSVVLFCFVRFVLEIDELCMCHTHMQGFELKNNNNNTPNFPDKLCVHDKRTYVFVSVSADIF